MAKTLLVIDIQNICVGKNNAKIFNYDKDKLITDINKKISSYDKNNVIYICNIMNQCVVSQPGSIRCLSQHIDIVKSIGVF